MKTVKDVDEYIANAPKEVQVKLKELRKAIKSAAPQAEEKISYAMPYYGYKGRLVYFGFAKKHIGLYVMQPTTEVFKKELKSYETTKVTIRFPMDEKLPISLIKRMIKSQVKNNDEKKK